MNLDRFEPISLGDLNATAALQTRVDRKYLLDRSELDALLAELPGTTQVLTIDDLQTFTYSSVYHDTQKLASYRLAATKRRRRYKVRTRRYVDTGTNWLEVKTVGGRGTTVKNRMAYRPGSTRTLTAIGRAYVADTLAASAIDPTDVAGLVPLLETSYRRTTLFLPNPSRPWSGARVTIDTDLAWVDLEDARALTRPDLAIVETKTGSTPSAMDRVLWAHGHRPSRISKFGTGLAALRPELPANKWNRALVALQAT